MYAVIKTGGKQYRVTPGDVLKVETLQAEVGASVNFEEVLMISDDGKLTVGSPLVASAKVAATVIAHGRAKKVEIIKFKRRKHHQKRTGHRQNFTQVQIQNINGKGKPENVMAPKTEEAKAANEAAAKSTAKKATKPAKAKAKPAAKKAAPKANTTEKKAAAKPATKKTATKAAPATTEKKPTTKKAAPKKSSAKDDLTKIEGIGPKAAEALTAAGLATFADVSKSTPTKIKKILDEAEGRFGAMNPGTWTKQAEMAAADKWDELKKWQDEMDGGVEK